jgi:hypothetical protein
VEVPDRTIASAMLARHDAFTRIRCQPCEVLESLAMPVGIGVEAREVTWDASSDRLLARLRVASAMGHALLLERMKLMGQAAGRELIADPMRGHLANLPLNDYRRFFRSYLPETLKGGQYLLQHGRLAADRSAPVEPDHLYPVQAAVDFHVFGAHRVENFVQSVRDANALSRGPERSKHLDKAGHLLYAAHASLTGDAGLSIPEADQAVADIRRNERQGYYGAGLAEAEKVVALVRLRSPVAGTGVACDGTP